MIIGGLDVCDAFKFHRDEDTEFLGHPVVSMVSMVSSSRQWSGEWGGTYDHCGCEAEKGGGLCTDGK